MEELNKLIENLYGYVTEFKETYDTNSQNTLKVLTFLVNKVEEHEKAQTSLNEKISSLNEEIAKSKNEIAELKESVSKLMKDADALKKSTKSHNSSIEDIKKEIENVKSNFVDVSSYILIDKNKMKKTSKFRQFLYKIFHWREIQKAKEAAAEAARLEEQRRIEEERHKEEERLQEEENRRIQELEEQRKRKEEIKKILNNKK